jgi:hypothetical protein
MFCENEMPDANMKGGGGSRVGLTLRTKPKVWVHFTASQLSSHSVLKESDIEPTV